MIGISNFRLSTIWVETVPDVLAGFHPGRPAFSFLTKPGDYVKLFNDLKSGSQGPSGIGFPWKDPAGHNFWRFYFEGRQAGTVTGSQAWKKLVPFRRKWPWSVAAIDNPATMTLEVFYCAHGLALLATASYRGEERPPLDIAELAHEVRSEVRFNANGPNAPTAALTMSRLVEAAFDAARLEAFGDTDAVPAVDRPLSVATFIQGSGVTKASLVVEGDDVHRTLEAITGWNPYFRDMSLADTTLATAKVPSRRMLDSDLVYARKSGRAVWFPRALTGTAKPSSRLSCYHRNLTLASLQAASLGELVAWTERRYEQSGAVPAAIDDRAKRAVAILELLARGDPHTYRSAGVQIQIVETGADKAMAQLRQRWLER